MSDFDALDIGVLDWARHDGISSMVADVCVDLGCSSVTRFLSDEKVPDGLDVIVVHGPLGSVVPLLNQMLLIHPASRPALALWMTEQLPNPRYPEWFRYSVGALRSSAERRSYRCTDPGEWRLDPRLRWVATTMHRFRYFGDLYWLARLGIPFVLVVGSQWTCRYLRERGFDPVEAIEHSTVVLASQSQTSRVHEVFAIPPPCQALDLQESEILDLALVFLSKLIGEHLA